MNPSVLGLLRSLGARAARSLPSFAVGGMAANQLAQILPTPEETEDYIESVRNQYHRDFDPQGRYSDISRTVADIGRGVVNPAGFAGDVIVSALRGTKGAFNPSFVNQARARESQMARSAELGEQTWKEIEKAVQQRTSQLMAATKLHSEMKGRPLTTQERVNFQREWSRRNPLPQRWVEGGPNNIMQLYRGIQDVSGNTTPYLRESVWRLR